MAFTVTARHSGNSATTSAQTLATGSTTPTANSLLLAGFGCQADSHSSDHTAQTPTGGSLTYTAIQTDGQGADDIPWDTSSSFSISGGLYRAPVGGSPSAFAITFDAFSTTNVGFYAAVACDITGHDPTTPVVQSATNGTSEGTGDSESSTVTLGSTPTAGNLIVVFAFAGADNGGGFASPTMGAGKTFTQLHNQNASWTQAGMWQRTADGAESTTVTISDLGQTVGNAILMVVEIAAESASGVTGTGALTSPAGILAGSGDVPRTGSGALTAAAPVLSGSGDVLTQGTGALTSPAGVLSGSGAVTNGPSGTGALTSPTPVLAGSGDVLVQGTGGLTSPAATLSGSGDVLVEGAGALTSPAGILSGSGSVSSGRTGTGALTSPSPVLAGSGSVLVEGSGALASPPPVLAGSGSVTNGPSGSGALTSPRPILAGLGEVFVSGTGALTSPAGVLSGFTQPPAWTFTPPHRGDFTPYWIRGVSPKKAEVPYGRFDPTIKRFPNVFLLTDDTLTEEQPPSWSQVAKVYYGGHTAVIEDLAEHDRLVAAGYDLEVYVP